jgi:hypothetical protein
MAEIITGDVSKGIKSVGELALKISNFDSYHLFTLYENITTKKLMDVSGNQKYYLVFRSPRKEIRIPEYEPNGYFEVDKVNGCVLFKITKKNADDILSLKLNEKIFYIVRVYEEKDAYGKVLSVTDEVEVYHGKWGEEEAFNTFTTDNKVDVLSGTVAVLESKYAALMKDYGEMIERYNDEVKKNTELEKEIELLRSELNTLQTTINEYQGDTYEGSVLSTDTKYIAFENTLDNITFTEEQYSNAINELMTKGEVDLSNIDMDEPRVDLKVKVYDDMKDLKIVVYKNDVSIGNAVYNQELHKTMDADNGDEFKFVCTGITGKTPKTLYLTYTQSSDKYNTVIEDENGNKVGVVAVDIKKPFVIINPNEKGEIIGKINYNNIVDVVGNIGTIECFIK